MPTVVPVFVVALLLLAGVIAAKVSGRFGIPALLLFLIIGMLAGSDGPGGIEFIDAGLTSQVGSVALAFILFSGGLEVAALVKSTQSAPALLSWEACP